MAKVGLLVTTVVNMDLLCFRQNPWEIMCYIIFRREDKPEKQDTVIAVMCCSGISLTYNKNVSKLPTFKNDNKLK